VTATTSPARATIATLTAQLVDNYDADQDDVAALLAATGPDMRLPLLETLADMFEAGVRRGLLLAVQHSNRAASTSAPTSQSVDELAARRARRAGHPAGTERRG
jgi:hypothetical protein